MTIVRVTWIDAVGQWEPWTSLEQIGEELADASIDTVGHLIEGHDTPFTVIAASVAKWGTKFQYGGVVAIPAGMVTSIETLVEDPPSSAT